MLKKHPHLASFLELTHDAVIIINSDGTILYANQDLYDMFEYSFNELVDKQLEILIPEKFHEIHIKYRSKFFTCPTKRPMGIGKALKGIKKSGLEFSVEISLSYLSVEETNMGMAIIRDLTERLEEKNKLQTNLEGILEAAPDGILMINDQGDIVLVNSQIQKLFGYDRQEIIGKPIEMLIPNRLHETHRQRRNQFFKNPTTRSMGLGKQLLAKRKDESEWRVEISLSPIIIDKQSYTIAIVRDITEKIKLEYNLN